MRSAPTRTAVASLLVLIVFVVSLPRLVAASTTFSSPEITGNRSPWLAPNNLGSFVHKIIDGRASCIEAAANQAQRIKDRNSNLAIVPDSDPSRVRQGLRIILRGTTQLNSFPLAVEAYRRAVLRWEALIQNRITIVIDVDFGPTLFGQRFDNDVLASCDSQVLGGNALFPVVRSALVSKALEPDARSLYDSLPPREVLTDVGTSAGIAAPSATLRALDLLSPIADLDGEASSFGLPPAIGINSMFKFDFDSGDGIAADQFDFEAIALHQIGHVLGFLSCVGQHEANPSPDEPLSIWDLFRLRPDVTNGSFFGGATRILSAGGEQSFYAGDVTVPLSTARPDGSGGDGRQSSHWKDDSLAGRYLGVMDPTIRPGEYHSISDNDTAALAAIGYHANSMGQPPTLIPLTSGQPERGGMIAPPPNAGALSHLQYSIEVPPNATAVKIDLNGNQDVDLFVRFGQRVFINGFHPDSDYVSAGDSGSESITITPTSSPALRTGTYYIAVANFGPGDADFTVTATVTGSTKGRAPSIFNIQSRLESDVLDLSCTATDLDGDVVRAQINLLDESGRSVAPASSLAVDSGNLTRVESGLKIVGLNGYPSAMRASLVLIDREGNRSPEAICNFGRADAGGLAVNSASFDDARLTVKTGGLVESLAVEINGIVVAPPQGIKIKGSGKLIVKGNAGQLGLRPGANRIRVKNSYGWSNILVLNM